jgi:hypothetical protein
MATVYGKFKVLIDGSAQVEASQISVEYAPGRNAVDTIEKGRAGYTEGAKVLTVSGTSAVPAAGLEFDFFKASEAGEEHAVQVVLGNKVIKLKATFMNIGAGMSANASGEVTWQCEGPGTKESVS